MQLPKPEEFRRHLAEKNKEFARQKAAAAAPILKSNNLVCKENKPSAYKLQRQSANPTVIKTAKPDQPDRTNRRKPIRSCQTKEEKS
jgi:hypothetical protein